MEAQSFITMKQYMPTTWNSIFIPALPSDAVNEEFIIHVMEDVLQLGKVKRVDLSLKKNHKNKYMAFVHFEFWYNNQNVHYFRNMIDLYGYYDIQGIMVPNTYKNIYMRFMVNKTPIKETKLNEHQLSANLEMAEAKIQDQENIINDLLRDLADAKTLIEKLQRDIKTPSYTKTNSMPLLERDISMISMEDGELDDIRKMLF